MKATILADNHSVDFLASEFGFSCYIEMDQRKILFDVGYSNVFLENALRLGIDLDDLDVIVFSHGHSDHTWGLAHFIQRLMQRVELQRVVKKPELVCCPGALEPKWSHEGHQNGFLINKETIASFFTVHCSEDPVWLSEHVVFLGKIERSMSFEHSAYKENVPPGIVKINMLFQEDLLLDDSAIVCKTPQGLVVVTGCSHSGICNIIEAAKRVCNEHRVIDVIGGFHLMNASDERLEKTCEYFKGLDLQALHACHCTDFKAKQKLACVAPMRETGVGLVIHI